MKYVINILFILVIFSCEKKTPQKTQSQTKDVAVLLVNHGSISEKWRGMLMDVEIAVKDSILANPRVAEIRTAFMEYTEPSIATQMKALDEKGYKEIVVVPIFLTISSHYLDDIPNIVGIKNDPKVIEELTKEKIKTYRAKSKITITPPLDYPSILKKNLLRRFQALSKNAKNEGVVLVAYGDAQFNQQWEELMEELGTYLKHKAGIQTVAYSWCGHLVHYSTEPTKNAIEQVLKFEDNAVVIPVLVSNDEYFQDKIIQTACNEVAEPKRVIYKQDAILPDENLNQWVIDISNQTVNGL